jgi:thiol-disulfide isomerase/thioredoxin
MAQTGPSSDEAAALSWVARAALAARRYDQADALAADTRAAADTLLRTRKIDSDPVLATAVGASIEVHAQVLAARGERAEAVAFLRRELAAFRATTLNERIAKNLNLLDLEGKPAPPVEFARWLGPRPPTLAALRGRPVLLFFWAHWCPDCKAQAASLAKLREVARDLVLLGPTKPYGYTARGEEAAPEAEVAYIEKVRRQSYGALPEMAVPVGDAPFQAYGASTTPTLVLIDRAGIVRWYHPGAVAEAELMARVRAAAGKREAAVLPGAKRP